MTTLSLTQDAEDDTAQNIYSPIEEITTLCLKTGNDGGMTSDEDDSDVFDDMEESSDVHCAG